MALMKHVIYEDGSSADVEMTPEEEAQFLADQATMEPTLQPPTTRELLMQTLGIDEAQLEALVALVKK